MLLHGGETVNDEKQVDASTSGHGSGLLELEGHQGPGYELVKRGIRSWVPWSLSLALDFIGTGILSRIMSRDGRNKHLSLSSLEKHEVRRRKLLWALYLMRDPFF